MFFIPLFLITSWKYLFIENYQEEGKVPLTSIDKHFTD